MDRPIVLVVEDNPLLRLNASDMIEEAGFDVIEAVDADDAVRILESDPNVRIVFTDVDMPGSMDGIRLAAAVRDRWPPIDIIVTSGQREVPATELPIRGLFFPKPTNWDKVTEAMRRFVLTD